MRTAPSYHEFVEEPNGFPGATHCQQMTCTPDQLDSSLAPPYCNIGVLELGLSPLWLNTTAAWQQTDKDFRKSVFKAASGSRTNARADWGPGARARVVQNLTIGWTGERPHHPDGKPLRKRRCDDEISRKGYDDIRDPEASTATTWFGRGRSSPCGLDTSGLLIMTNDTAISPNA